MKRLLKKQALYIDDHNSGVKLPCFDDPAADVHLDKKSNEGIYRIRIPLNSDRPVQVHIKGIKQKDAVIPRDLREEIQDAFCDKKKREGFIKDLVDILNNYPCSSQEHEFDSEGIPQKAFSALKRLSKHFDLQWDDKTVRGYLKDYKYYGTRYIATVTDGPDLYYFSCDDIRIVAADYRMVNIQDKNHWKELSYRRLCPDESALQ